MKMLQFRRSPTGRNLFDLKCGIGSVSAPLCVIVTALLLAQPAMSQGAADEQPAADPLWDALARVPATIDASPLPNYSGDFVSLGAEGNWHQPVGSLVSLYNSAEASERQVADCSPEAIVHYARQAPNKFEIEKNGLLYGVRTHTPETRVSTRYWDMPGFNSCALVVYAILKKAGCGWAKYTANAKAIYDMAYRGGWRPSDTQRGGCMVAWNSRWEGSRARIGTAQKQSKSGSTRFRHVGIATGSWLSVDNSSWLGRPTTFLTFRPLAYEAPIFLCPPRTDARQQAKRSQGEE
jgi:hypothetical protein